LKLLPETIVCGEPEIECIHLSLNNPGILAWQSCHQPSRQAGYGGVSPSRPPGDQPGVWYQPTSLTNRSWSWCVRHVWDGSGSSFLDVHPCNRFRSTMSARC